MPTDKRNKKAEGAAHASKDKATKGKRTPSDASKTDTE